MTEPAELGFWTRADTVTSVLVNLSVLLAAIAAMIKLRVLNMLARRYKSELVCHHWLLPSGSVLFEANYAVTNTGERPITLSEVSLSLCASARDGVLLKPDREHVLAARRIQPVDRERRAMSIILAGERSAFTLRCELPFIEPVVFVVCQLSWPYKREPAPFIGMYASAAARAPGDAEQPGR